MARPVRFRCTNPRRYNFRAYIYEWACRQLASFCGSAAAAEVCLAASIEVANNLDRARELQQETLEAHRAQISVPNIDDVRPLLAALRGSQNGSGFTTTLLHPLQLTAIAKTMQAALALRASIMEQANASALAVHAMHVVPQLQGLVDTIAHAIDLDKSTILDRSSAPLAAARLARRENAAALDAEMNRWCQELHRQGASEVRTPVIRRGRQCCSVKRGRSGVRCQGLSQDLVHNSSPVLLLSASHCRSARRSADPACMQILPKNSVTLDTSKTGATLYMEPKTAMPFNNAASQLESTVKAEEEKVLAELCGIIIAGMRDIEKALAAMTALDLASARAQHAKCAPFAAVVQHSGSFWSVCWDMLSSFCCLLQM